MAKRSGFEKFMVATVKASIRASRQAEAQRRRIDAEKSRDYQRSIKENARFLKECEKREKQEYVERRIQQAKDDTNLSNDLFNYLRNGLIPQTLKINDTILFQTLKPKYEPPVFSIPLCLEKSPEKPLEKEFLDKIKPLSSFGKLFKTKRIKWQQKILLAKQEYQKSFSKWEKEIEEIEQKKKEEHEKWLLKSRSYEASYKEKVSQIAEFHNDYTQLDPEAVIDYVTMVLENSKYKIDWGRNFEIAYNGESKEILIEFEMPPIDVIPPIQEYKYVKTRDEIDEKLRKKQDINTAYSELLCSMAIRTIHEVLESDQAKAIEIIGFNGYVDTIDPRTGERIKPVLLSISVTKDIFNKIILEKIEPISCVRGLSASFSSSPNELVPVKPIREFCMVDKRFVKEEDIASKLDDRPNLMELNPFEFENLVSNLFSKMGLETKQTRSSKDGGVDAVAFDVRPILGGKVVIQAKRYKNTVGVSAVRDLYGTMINEGASKGILVATSGFGPDAYDFSKDKPIELVDGGGLLYLLGQVGIRARILVEDNS